MLLDIFLNKVQSTIEQVTHSGHRKGEKEILSARLGPGCERQQTVPGRLSAAPVSSLLWGRAGGAPRAQDVFSCTALYCSPCLSS